MGYDFTKGIELLEICEKNNKKIWEVMVLREERITGRKREDIVSMMGETLKVMKEAVRKGLNEDIKSLSGLTGGDAKKLYGSYCHDGREPVSGLRMIKAIASAMAVVEVNSSMGQIIAAPTAGSCGIIPGVFISLGEDFNLRDEELIQALFTAAAIGLIISKNATVAGAEGGCQAETGTAAAMAAAGVVELFGGTPEMALNGSAMTIKNILGLVCDPIAGLVEAPCIKRNAMGAANALICADMALAGIKSIIPFDEVVETMYKVGRSLPCELRETSQGGLAATPTGLKIMEDIVKKGFK